jgi:hypothetical protein
MAPLTRLAAKRLGTLSPHSGERVGSSAAMSRGGGPRQHLTGSAREAAGEPLEIGKYPIPPLISEPTKGVLEIMRVVHVG